MPTDSFGKNFDPKATSWRLFVIYSFHELTIARQRMNTFGNRYELLYVFGNGRNGSCLCRRVRDERGRNLGAHRTV